jgi:hypothetical protein
VLTEVDTNTCPNSRPTFVSQSVNETISLLQIAPNGSVTLTPLDTESNTYYSQGPNTTVQLRVREAIPDGKGGVLSPWLKLVIFEANTTITETISDVSGGGVNNFVMSSLQNGAEIVLGDQGSNTAYVTDGSSLVAFNTSSGAALWTYTSSTGNLNLIAAVAGGGVVAKSTTSGVDTVLRFDASGNLTTDSLSASGLDYYIGNLWTGFPYSGGAPVGYAVGYYDGPVQLSNSGWAGGTAFD